jgi:hypothetical protein
MRKITNPNLRNYVDRDAERNAFEYLREPRTNPERFYQRVFRKIIGLL